MNDFIKTLEIQNFKSVKNLKLNCKRINILIGKPNVGKSNILEALSLFGLPYTNQIKDFARILDMKDLYYDRLVKENIIIKTNEAFTGVQFLPEKNLYCIMISNSSIMMEALKTDSDILKYRDGIGNVNTGEIFSDFAFTFDDKGSYNGVSTRGLVFNDYNNFLNKIKKYTFQKINGSEDITGNFLKPPFGNNLNIILSKNIELASEIASYFEEYGLEFGYVSDKNIWEIQKKINKVYYKYPIELVADTLQRMIFYITAIETNKNSILIFEEPEVHAFLPYVSELSERIADDKDNQYFITTHNPFVVNTLIENTKFEESAIFICDYKNYQTIVRELNKSEHSELINYGIDIFHNLKYFDHEEA